MITLAAKTDMLLIIDPQVGFASKGLSNITPLLLRLTNEFSGRVAITKFLDIPGSHFETLLGWSKFQDKRNQMIIPELANLEATQFTHLGYGVLNEKLEKYLKKAKSKRVFLAGLYTDVCIIHTAMQLFDAGWEVFVISDACASLHGADHHLMALDTLKHIIGRNRVVTSRELIEKP